MIVDFQDDRPRPFSKKCSSLGRLGRYLSVMKHEQTSGFDELIGCLERRLLGHTRREPSLVMVEGVVGSSPRPQTLATSLVASDGSV